MRISAYLDTQGCISSSNRLYVNNRVIMPRNIKTARRRCCYFNCRIVENSCTETFFNFPKEESRRNDWVKNCGNPLLLQLEEKQLIRRAVCEKHFLESDILVGTKRNLLCKRAVPIKYCKTQKSNNSLASTSKVWFPPTQQDGEYIPTVKSEKIKSFFKDNENVESSRKTLRTGNARLSEPSSESPYKTKKTCSDNLSDGPTSSSLQSIGDTSRNESFDPCSTPSTSRQVWNENKLSQALVCDASTQTDWVQEFLKGTASYASTHWPQNIPGLNRETVELEYASTRSAKITLQDVLTFIDENCPEEATHWIKNQLVILTRSYQETRKRTTETASQVAMAMSSRENQTTFESVDPTTLLGNINSSADNFPIKLEEIKLETDELIDSNVQHGSFTSRNLFADSEMEEIKEEIKTELIEDYSILMEDLQTIKEEHCDN